MGFIALVSDGKMASNEILLIIIELKVCQIVDNATTKILYMLLDLG